MYLCTVYTVTITSTTPPPLPRPPPHILLTVCIFYPVKNDQIYIGPWEKNIRVSVIQQKRCGSTKFADIVPLKLQIIVKFLFNFVKQFF